MVAILISMFAYLKARPSVNPSAHLWQTTANDIPIHSGTSCTIPIASPSNTAWIPNIKFQLPIAICNIKGVNGDCYSFKIFYLLGDGISVDD